jgi:hypothetical protein
MRDVVMEGLLVLVKPCGEVSAHLAYVCLAAVRAGKFVNT